MITMTLCHYAQIKHTQQVAARSCSMTVISIWNLCSMNRPFVSRILFWSWAGTGLGGY
jgi:hypothetical protein